MFKIFYADEYGEVHFSKEEFESILNEVYNAGYEEGKKRMHIWSSSKPYWTSPYYTTNDSTITSKPNITYTTATSANANGNITIKSGESNGRK